MSEPNMSPNPHTDVIEAPEDLMADVLSSAQAAHISLMDDLAIEANEPIDLTEQLEPTAPNPVVEPDVDAVAKDDELIDEALRQASGILSHGQTQADELIEQAQQRALAIVGDADEAAMQMVADARVEAQRIEGDAERAATLAVESAREEYKAKATEISNNAIADSRLLVANAEEQAREICERSQVKAERLISAAASTIEEKHHHANETLAALTTLTESRISDAEQSASAIVRRATAESNEIREQCERDAQELRKAAQAQADEILNKASEQADEMVATVEELKATAHARLSAAAAEAAERGAAAARQKIEAQLIDTRREVQDLEDQIVARRAELGLLEAASVTTEPLSPVPSAVSSQVEDAVDAGADASASDLA